MTDHILTGWMSKSRGVIGRYPDAGDRYVFPFDMPKKRGVHMIGVNKPLQVSWYLGDELVKRKVLRPWIGHGSALADKVVEEPAHV
jgi:hypothetical protein